VQDNFALGVSTRLRSQGEEVCPVRTLDEDIATRSEGRGSSDTDARTFWCQNFGLWCVHMV